MADDAFPGGAPSGGEPREILAEWPAWLMLAALWAGSLALASRLPARVPIHWDFHGQPNGWAGPWGAALLAPALATGFYGLTLLLDWGRLDFRSARRMAPATARQVRLLIVALLCGLQAVVLRSAAGGAFRDGLMLGVLSLFLVLLGNLMPRLEPNAWVGLRLPPTLENRDVWRATHRFTGRWLVGAGLLGLPLSLVPGPAIHQILLVLVLVPLGAGAVRAYVLRHRMEVRGILPPEA